MRSLGLLVVVFVCVFTTVLANARQHHRRRQPRRIPQDPYAALFPPQPLAPNFFGPPPAPQDLMRMMQVMAPDTGELAGHPDGGAKEELKNKFEEIISADREAHKQMATALEMQKIQKEQMDTVMKSRAEEIMQREKFLKKMEKCINQDSAEAFMETNTQPPAEPKPVVIEAPKCDEPEELKMYKAKIRSKSDLPRCETHDDCGGCSKQMDCGWCPASSVCMELQEHRECEGELLYLPSKCPSVDDEDSDSDEVEEPQVSKCRVTSRVRVLTLNVGSADRESWAPLLKLLIESKADVIALQEVSDRLYNTLQAQPYYANFYESKFSTTHAPGGLYIISRFPILNVAYYERTQPGQVKVESRGRVLVADVQTSQINRLTIANTILDWKDSVNRAVNLDFMFSILDRSKDVLFVGDFNFDARAEPETTHIPEEFDDVWTSLNSSFAFNAGDSWNPAVNMKARLSDPTSQPSRLDRMFLKSDIWRGVRIGFAGDTKDAKYPTSHFALVSDIVAKEKTSVVGEMVKDLSGDEDEDGEC